MKPTLANSLTGFFLGLGLALGPAVGHTEETAQTDLSQVQQNLQQHLEGMPIEEVRATPIANIYEIMVAGSVAYVTGDGRYLLAGKLVDLETKADLTEPRLMEAKRDTMAAVGEDSMVIYSPEKPQHTITVFTDIDCGYCRKLHAEIDDFLKEGIRVRYLFYPRAGIGSESYATAVSVWCSGDRNQALTDAKAGKKIPSKECDNPVTRHLILGERLGVRGTPAIVLEDGSMLPGYVPAKRLKMLLESGS